MASVDVEHVVKHYDTADAVSLTGDLHAAAGA